MVAAGTRIALSCHGGGESDSGALLDAASRRWELRSLQDPLRPGAQMNARIVASLGLAVQFAAIHVIAAQGGVAKADSAATSAAGNAVVAQEQAVLDAIARS